MMAYALRCLGLREGETRLYVQSWRKFDDGGAEKGGEPDHGASRAAATPRRARTPVEA